MDTYQAVTDRIITALEAGTVPWQKPWAATGPSVTGQMFDGGRAAALQVSGKLGANGPCT